jgi:CheY-like chemotaxis protein
MWIIKMDQNIFFDEFKSKLQSLENSLIDIKNNNSTDETINEIFRSIHTIKGTADLLGLFTVVLLAHKTEDILTKIRDKELKMSQSLCSLFFEFKDYISLVIYNTSVGIFDDEVTEKLVVYFEKEFLNVLSDNKKVLKTILVVEDSTIIRYMIKNIVIEHGYSILSVDNGIDGFKKIQNSDIDIDLILCEFGNKEIGTEDMILSLKNDIKYNQIPIVMLVDNINKELQSYGKSIEAKAWITKPIDKNKLLMVLDKILSE